MTEEITGEPRVPNQSFYRWGREIKTSSINLEKLRKAEVERGIRIEVTSAGKVQVNKIVVKGDDER